MSTDTLLTAVRDALPDDVRRYTPYPVAVDMVNNADMPFLCPQAAQRDLTFEGMKSNIVQSVGTVLQFICYVAPVAHGSEGAGWTEAQKLASDFESKWCGVKAGYRLTNLITNVGYVDGIWVINITLTGAK